MESAYSRCSNLSNVRVSKLTFIPSKLNKLIKEGMLFFLSNWVLLWPADRCYQKSLSWQESLQQITFDDITKAAQQILLPFVVNFEFVCEWFFQSSNPAHSCQQNWLYGHIEGLWNTKKGFVETFYLEWNEQKTSECCTFCWIGQN